MRFNWKQFCSERGVLYVTSGPNTAAGNISIKCPFCGDSDPSEHMGLSLDTNRPFWSCWRSRLHRGRDPVRLIAKLLHLNFESAKVIAQGQGENPDMFEQAVESLSQKKEEVKTTDRRLTLPKTFREFDLFDPSSTQRRFDNYLMIQRGFGLFWQAAVRLYQLRWCVSGDYFNRLIIPVYYEGELVTWTGRAITPSSLRYRSLEVELEVRNVKDCLLRPGGMLLNRDTLFITEGPMDAMKMEIFGSERGASSVAVFGLTLSNLQLEMLGKILPCYSQVVVLLDAKERAAGSIMADQIEEMWGGNVKQGTLPSRVKDPGDLNRPQVHMLVSTMRKHG